MTLKCIAPCILTSELQKAVQVSSTPWLLHPCLKNRDIHGTSGPLESVGILILQSNMSASAMNQIPIPPFTQPVTHHYTK
jgi:hypothetical protein